MTIPNPAVNDSLFLPYQQRWIDDTSPLKIIEKSRQIGITYADACDSVFKAADRLNGNDVWVSSRDENTAILYLAQCKRWARALNYLASDLGARIVDKDRDLKAHVLNFASGWSIYCLSSCPDALVGKSGHIKLDEFAIHKDQRELFRVAKPCTTWGGQLSIISTHRGHCSVFNEILRSIKESGNPMGFSHHRVTIHDAVEQGLVDRLNILNSHSDTPGQFIARLRAGCLDEEQWLQEYCCQPADESSAFITWELLTACESPGCIEDFDYLSDADNPLYIGVDVGRKHHLTVIDVGEKIGDIHWDRLRIELHDTPFSQIEDELFRVLSLPSVKRCCIDATGIGLQLAERTRQRFGWKVEPVHFTAQIKEELAFALRNAFEDRKLRIDSDPKLKADLRGIKKTVTSAGNIRFLAENEDSHCDRFWAKALRHHAAEKYANCQMGAAVA